MAGGTVVTNSQVVLIMEHENPLCSNVKINNDIENFIEGINPLASERGPRVSPL